MKFAQEHSAVMVETDGVQYVQPLINSKTHTRIDIQRYKRVRFSFRRTILKRMPYSKGEGKTSSSSCQDKAVPSRRTAAREFFMSVGRIRCTQPRNFLNFLSNKHVRSPPYT